MFLLWLPLARFFASWDSSNRQSPSLFFVAAPCASTVMAAVINRRCPWRSVSCERSGAPRRLCHVQSLERSLSACWGSVKSRARLVTVVFWWAGMPKPSRLYVPMTLRRTLTNLWSPWTNSSPPLKPGQLRLFHGTDRRSASAILNRGVNPERLSPCCDFGRAFYLTPSHTTALNHATARAYLARAPYRNHAALICIDFDPGELPLDWCLHLEESGGNHRRWVDIVMYCRRGLAIADELRMAFLVAPLVVGPISSNGTAIDGGREPRPGPDMQYSFRPEVQSAAKFINTKLLDASTTYLRFMAP